jgi:hypothetical protein
LAWVRRNRVYPSIAVKILTKLVGFQRAERLISLAFHPDKIAIGHQNRVHKRVLAAVPRESHFRLHPHLAHLAHPAGQHGKQIGAVQKPAKRIDRQRGR